MKRKSSICTCNSFGLTHAFTVENLEFFGGGIRYLNLDDYDLVLNASGVPATTRVKGNGKARELFPSLFSIKTDAAVIEIDWPDGSVPPLPREWWINLVNKLKRISASPFRIACCCVGGHGRTGTMLSIFAGLLNQGKDPVAFVRRNYCPRAVESLSQKTYIEMVTGKEVRAKIEKYVWYGGGDIHEMY